MPVRFGTDGLRGVANAELTPELATALGRAVARCVPATAFVIGRDTRRSGSMLSAALAAGLATEGADVIDLGILPTPGVAYACASTSLPGLVVSASHNPFTDNGIKLLGVGGVKADPQLEAEVEEQLERILADPSCPPLRPLGYSVGVISADEELLASYVESLGESITEGSCAGLSLVIDAAHGAASAVCAEAFADCGATVTVIHAEPDGTNINDRCGSTDVSTLAQTVISLGADLGLALDGDADRLIAVDATGAVVDGDVMIAIFAKVMKERGLLAGKSVVVTTMTNLGFHHAMEREDISVRQVDVGDRNVLRVLEAEGLALGGEQSGHVIFRQLATTGDGMLTGLLLSEIVATSGRSLAELAAAAMTKLPQVLLNVAVEDPQAAAELPSVLAAAEEISSALADSGRVLLRPSGTEALVRVMVEASTEPEALQIAERLAEVVRLAASEASTTTTVR